MDLLELLKNNKGTVSSALGKELALKVLDGDTTILEHAVKLVSYEYEKAGSKNVRAGAAKIIEKVAEKKPELVEGYLKQMKNAFHVKEPQTRWMMMQTFGYCASFNLKEALSVFSYAVKFLNEDAGVCLKGAVYMYLGRIGAECSVTADDALAILDESMRSAPENEVDWILEAFYMIIDKAEPEIHDLIRQNANLHLNAKKKATQNRAKKILKKLDSN